MSREILFKAKTTKKEEGRAFNNEWVKGDLLESRGKYYIHPKGNFFQVNGELTKNVIVHEVLPETIRVCTGLNDTTERKWGEGCTIRNQIFVGDFLKTDNNSRLYRVYLDECNRIQIQDFYGFAIKPTQDAINYFKAVVVGNEIDNPELMEKWREQDE